MNQPNDPSDSPRSGSLMSSEPANLPAHPAPLPTSMWLDPPQEEQGVSLVGLLHSLRRRWLPASLIGGLLACIVGFVLYLIIPVTYEAISMVRVSQNDKGVFGRSNRWSSGQFDVYKQTQETLMTSPFVLDAALRDPDVLALETIRREDNKLSFLQSELSAKFQGKGEILRLSMRGKRKDDLIKIVDAVIDAYLEEIAASGRRENVERLEILRKARKEHLDAVRETSDKIHRLAEELGTSDSELARMTEQIEMSQLGELERKKLRILNEYEQLYMDLSLIRAKGQSPKIKPHPYDVEMGLANNPKFRELKDTLDYLDQQMMSAQGTARPGSAMITRLQAERSSVAQELASLERELRPQVEHRLKRELYGVDETRDEAAAFQLEQRLALLQQQLQGATQQYEEQLEKMKSLTGYSSELVLQKGQLQSLTELSDEIGQEISKLEMALESPNRIQRVQPAIVPNMNSLWLKVMQVFAACLVTFGVTVVAIAAWDFITKRLNTSQELEKSVGVSVIGALPAIRPSGFSLVGNKGNREAVITDAIDSIRAAITYGERGKATRSVVVTSAVGEEGKSTVASQLAVSLARGGRRTLLLDGDIRNPAQHAVFGLPGDRGLCEVLREQADLEDVVQTTPAENLWILPAGRCDALAFRAFSSDALSAIMERLSTQFDFIVVDSGPVLTGPEALIFGQYVDGAILSTRRDISQLPKVDDAYRRLQSVGVHVIGSVVNGIDGTVRSSALALTSAR